MSCKKTLFPSSVLICIDVHASFGFMLALDSFSCSRVRPSRVLQVQAGGTRALGPRGLTEAVVLVLTVGGGELDRRQVLPVSLSVAVQIAPLASFSRQGLILVHLQQLSLRNINENTNQHVYQL